MKTWLAVALRVQIAYPLKHGQWAVLLVPALAEHIFADVLFPRYGSSHTRPRVLPTLMDINKFHVCATALIHTHGKSS